MRALTAERPLALLIDDMQWADEDSLRLLRYVIRTEGASPIFVLFSIRPEELASLEEAVTLLADMERMRVVRRLTLARFSVVETNELLRQLLGGQVEAATASTIHGQAEGVPFIVEEIARAYREAGMLQEVADTWSLARNAGPAGALGGPDADPAPGGPPPDGDEAGPRRGRAPRSALQPQGPPRAPAPDRGGRRRRRRALGNMMAPAVSTGLLLEQPEAAPADYSFPHEQVREFAADTLAPARRRDPRRDRRPPARRRAGARDAPAPRPSRARGRRRAGLREVLRAGGAAAALAAHAPEEVLRVVEVALPQASTPQERLDLLIARDDALAMLRRPGDRLEGCPSSPRWRRRSAMPVWTWT